MGTVFAVVLLRIPRVWDCVRLDDYGEVCAQSKSFIQRVRGVAVRDGVGIAPDFR